MLAASHAALTGGFTLMHACDPPSVCKASGMTETALPHPLEALDIASKHEPWSWCCWTVNTHCEAGIAAAFVLRTLSDCISNLENIECLNSSICAALTSGVIVTPTLCCCPSQVCIPPTSAFRAELSTRLHKPCKQEHAQLWHCLACTTGSL